MGCIAAGLRRSESSTAQPRAVDGSTNLAFNASVETIYSLLSRPHFNYVLSSTHLHMAAFRFRSLESDSHFRILYLHSGADDEQLSASLVHHNLDEHPTYDCLSYAWGCSTRSHNVLVDGSSFPITFNLYSALKRIRARDSHGQIALWADGICINQDDIPERNQQVKLMRSIYSECRTGLMYLGEAADGSDLIPEFLETLTQSINALFKKTNEPSTLDLQNESAFPEENDPGWKRLKALLHRPWFQRVWIIQEFALPQQIQMICGQWEIPGTYLASLLHIPIWTYSQSVLTALLDEKTGAAIENHQLHLKARHAAGRDIGLCVDPNASIAPDVSVARRHQSLIWLLDQSTSFLATNPRDKIFALIPLSSDSSDPALTVDYSKTMETVAVETAQHFVRNGYGLSLLLSARSASSSTSSPSWFPDWMGSENPEKFTVWPMRYDKIPDCQIISTPNPQTITVVGSFVDVVQDLGIPTGSEILIDENKKWIHDLDTLVAKIQAYPTGQEVDEAVWRTLIADRSIDKQSPAPEVYGNLYRAARNINAIFKLRSTSLHQMVEATHDALHFEAATLRGSRFSITGKRYFSMLPKQAEVGDFIFVVKGDQEKATFLVRRDHVLDQYQWIGHAYVHDIWKVLKFDDLENKGITVY